MPKSRRTIAEAKAALREQLDRIEAEKRAKEKILVARLSKLEAKERTLTRRQDTHLKVVIGAAAQAHARLDPAWAAELRRMLDRAVSKEADRLAVKQWFDRLASGTADAPEKSRQATPARAAALAAA